MKPKWCDVLSRIVPWLAPQCNDTQRLRDAAAVITAEQEALEPLIDVQTQQLEARRAKNGFTSQLRAGFQRRLAGE